LPLPSSLPHSVAESRADQSRRLVRRALIPASKPRRGPPRPRRCSSRLVGRQPTGSPTGWWRTVRCARRGLGHRRGTAGGGRRWPLWHVADPVGSSEAAVPRKREGRLGL